ncbi:MAG: FHA domain-containing protein [Fuerstiella sp.]
MSQRSSETEAKTATAKSRVTALVPIWDSGEQTLILSDDRTFRAGRGRDCDLLIAHPGVAEWHATVIRNDGQVSVSPEHGQHVWVNDQLIDQASPVHAGDTLAIGPATFRIEARRAGRRIASSRPTKASADFPDVSARLEQHLNDLQQHYANAVEEANFASGLSGAAGSGSGFEMDLPVFAQQPPGHHNAPPRLPTAPSANHGTPFLDFAATTNRRSALDERESQLNEWHRSLDRRREELDKRSANLTKQQAALTARQAELDHRTAELESWQQSALNDIEERKANVNTAAKADLRLQKEQLQAQERELREEQQLVSEQLRRMEDSRQSIADQLKSLEDARTALKDERAELVEERSRLESETRARQQADSEQEAAFKEQREKLDHFAHQLEEERTALQQQEASLRDEQQRLKNRTTEVADAEERIQLVADSSTSAEDNSEPRQQNSSDNPVHHIDEEATQAARLLLEEQKANLTEQQDVVQQQLDAVRRKEDEFDLLKADVEGQLAELAAAQTALEFDRLEAVSALEEARRLQQEAEDAHACSVEEAEAAELEEPHSHPATQDAALREELLTREQELSERTQELANRLAELKSWKKQLEAREVASSEAAPVAAEAPSAAAIDRPKSVIASQLSSLLLPSGMMPETDGLKDSAADEKLAASEQQNASLQTETAELRDRVAELELQLKAAEQESTNLSSLLTQGELPANGRALTEQNLLAELQALKSELSDSQDADSDATENGEQVVVHSQISELEARNEAMLENHQQEIAKYEDTISELNAQLELVQKQFEALEERAMAAVAAAPAPAAPVEDNAADGVAADGVAADGVADKSNADSSDADAASDQTVQKLTEMAQQLSEKLEQRNSTIDNLQAQLNGGIPVDSSASMSPQELNVLTQELDSRTVLLDEREAALRERERLIEQSEQELQAQRVALQEARQQLELARAEIHSAREPDASESMLLPRDLIDSVTELAEAGASSSPSVLLDEQKEEVAEEPDVAERSSVRSEFAELFGLGAKAKIEKEEEPAAKSPATAAELMEAVDDYSQESAAAVSLSFESAQDMLMAPDSESKNDDDFQDEPAAPVKEEADDVVASYMEQLLSRSRAHADGGAPETEKPQAGNATVAAKKEEPKEPAGQSSFIDKYMSGQYNSDKASDTQKESAASTSESTAEAQLAKDESVELRRSKIDREAQRLDLQSFRELSTQSAANALATHARRQQKGGITTRTTILTTLGLISVFVLAAAIIGVIPFGWLTTISIIAVCASAGELAYKMKTIQDEVNERTRIATMSNAVKTAALDAASAEDSLNEAAEAKAKMANPAVADSSVDAAEMSGLGTPSQPAEQSHESVSTAAASLPTDVAESVANTNRDAVTSTPESAASTAATASHAAEESDAESMSDLASKAASATDSTQVAGVAQTAAEQRPTEAADAGGGVPDAFDQAFRMLTSTSLPVKPDDSDSAAAGSTSDDSTDNKPSAE